MASSPVALLNNVSIDLSATLQSLPPAFDAQLNVSQLAFLFQSLISAITPAIETISSATVQSLATNVTYVAANLQALEGALQDMPPAEVNRSSVEELTNLIAIGATKYDFTTLWAPETWSVLFVFMYAVAAKMTLVLLVPKIRRSPPSTTLPTLEKSGSVGDTTTRTMSPEKIRIDAEQRVRAMYRHASNLLMSTIVLVIQLCGYRLFGVPGTFIRVEDYRLVVLAIKLILLPYGLELLFSDPHSHIYLHHILTFGLLFVGQLTAYETKDLLLARITQWWILQASTEQATYFGMLCFHTSAYLQVLDSRPRLRQNLLVVASRSMTFASWIAYPQKFIPIGFAIYWLGRMWVELEKASAVGRFWLGWCTILLVALIIMQTWFCDESFAMAAHFKAKVSGGESTQRAGPLVRWISSRFKKPRRSSNGNRGSNPPVSEIDNPLQIMPITSRDLEHGRATPPDSLQALVTNQRPGVTHAHSQASSSTWPLDSKSEEMEPSNSFEITS
ncbi:hypothetical protein SISNIDRAFT_488122 [Sistotremastrum niveocremeum HHB9708]|uniref:Uncharacterized protein n=1 Tax=Sistotremastrum niveocremeum HHB9708 TaxID=1314777 RepID=A0A164RS97_9AGAM|nr:hypothetical protein SISNIDRAFT_488122 [Sistotremastrum niveocremeum HHB9708]